MTRVALMPPALDCSNIVSHNGTSAPTRHAAGRTRTRLADPPDIAPARAGLGPHRRGWRKGNITAWILYTGSTGWEVAITAEGPQELPWQGRYVHDELAIRPRHDDTPPR